MAADFRANATGNDGATAASTTVPITIPATAVDGDYAVAVLSINSTTITSGTPTGWTVLAGPNVVGTSSTGYLFGKTIASGEPGTTVTWTLSASVRAVGHMAVYSGATATGLLVGTPTVDDVLDTDAVIPTIASVPAGAVFHVHSAFQKGGDPPPDMITPSGYLQGANGRSSTANTTGAVVAAETVYKIVPSAGTYGGETATTDLNQRSVCYAVAIPAASTGPNVGTASGTVTVAGTAAGERSPVATASGTVTTAGAAAGQRTPKATAAGAFSVTGSASGVRAAQGTAAGTVTVTGGSAGQRNPVGTATGTVTTTGSATGNAPTVGAEGTASGTVTVTGTAVGVRAPKATATGTVTVTGAASGITTRTGTATGTVTITGTATGPAVAARNLTLHIGAGRSRTLTAAGRARALAAVGRSRTLTAEPRE